MKLRSVKNNSGVSVPGFGGERMPINNADLSSSLTAIEEAQDITVLRALMLCAALVDIRSAYFLAPLTADPRIGRLLTNIGFSRTWERHYRARLHRFDPLPGISLTRSNAFSWPEDFKTARLSREQKRYLAIAARYGLGGASALPVTGPTAAAAFWGPRGGRQRLRRPRSSNGFTPSARPRFSAIAT